MKTFNFFKDEKCTIWYRGEFEVEADSYEEAVAKVKQMEENPNLYDEVDVRWDVLHDTIEELNPEENDGQPTAEVYSADTSDLIYANAEGRDPIKM